MPNVVDTEDSLDDHTNQVLFHPRIASSKGGLEKVRVDEEFLSEVSLITGQVIGRFRGSILPGSATIFEPQHRGFAPQLLDDETDVFFVHARPQQQSTTRIFNIRDRVLSDANCEPIEALGELTGIGAGSSGQMDRHLAGIHEFRDLERGVDANPTSVTGDLDSVWAADLASWTGAFGYCFTSSAPWLDDLLGKLEEMRYLEPGWDSYEALPPNEWALKKAQEALWAFASRKAQPDKVLPSVENGVGISVTRGERYGFLEVLNSHEVVGVTAYSREDYEVWELDPNNIAEAVGKICAFTVE